MMMNNCIKFMLVEQFLKFASDKIEFLKFVIFRQKTEISPKNKCSIFIKITYAQLNNDDGEQLSFMLAAYFLKFAAHKLNSQNL